MQTIGRFQLVHRIAVGGMAEVFLGRMVGEGGFEKVVAIKRILNHLAQNEKFIRMFMDEARISANLNHSNIGQIFEFGRAGETYFIAMEYIGGLSLRSVLRHFRKQLGQPPPPQMIAYVMSHVCAALDYAHNCSDSYGQRLHIIHRDVSPSNVLISFNGEVKLIDFGVAKASHRIQETVGGDLKGKYAYMSPEQATGGKIDHRSDIFSTGIILLEMLMGQNPFRADNDLATLTRIQQAHVPLPAATLQGDSIQLYEIASRALARSPRARFQSAGDIQEALERYSRRGGFGQRMMARWMTHTFPDRQRRVQKLLRKAAEEDAPTVELSRSPGAVLRQSGGIELAPSGSAGGQPDGAQGLAPPSGPPSRLEPQPLGAHQPSQVAQPPAAAPPQQPLPLTRGRLVTPTANPSLTPSGRSVADGPVRVESGLDPRMDPSRSLTPATPSNTEPSVVGKVAVPAGYSPSRVGRVPRRRGTSPLVHVLLFLIFAGSLGGGGYYYYKVYAPQHKGPPPTPVGSVRIAVEPAVGAQVYLDGQLHGAMGAGESYLLEGLLAGKHRVMLRGGDSREAEMVVEVRKGTTTPLVVDLSKKKKKKEKEKEP